MKKKGWIKIVEAFVAILLIAGVVLVVLGERDSGEKGFSAEIHDTQISLIREIQLNNTLRGEILGTSGIIEWASFPSQTKAKIQNEIPSYLDCSAKICSPSGPCLLTGQEEDVYAETAIISADLNTFNPRMLKLFCWTK